MDSIAVFVCFIVEELAHDVVHNAHQAFQSSLTNTCDATTPCVTSEVQIDFLKIRTTSIRDCFPIDLSRMHQIRSVQTNRMHVTTISCEGAVKVTLATLLTEEFCRSIWLHASQLVDDAMYNSVTHQNIIEVARQAFKSAILVRKIHVPHLS